LCTGPIAPGDERTYNFRLTQFGTTWYHSHHSAQYGEGLTGQIIVNGPASANYDVDLGVFPIADWYYKSIFEINLEAKANLQRGAPPPPPDNLLLNGTNKNINGGGEYTRIQVQKGKKYRLRLINTSVDSNFRVSIDNHPLTIMTSDFVPVKSIQRDWVLLSIGKTAFFFGVHFFGGGGLLVLDGTWIFFSGFKTSRFLVENKCGDLSCRARNH